MGLFVPETRQQQLYRRQEWQPEAGFTFNGGDGLLGTQNFQEGFRSENIAGPFMDPTTPKFDVYRPQEGYSPFTDEDPLELNRAPAFLGEARSPEEYRARMHWFDVLQARRERAAQTFMGNAGAFIGSIFNPDSLLLSTKTVGIVRGAAKGGAALGVEEMALHAFDPTRTLDQSVNNVLLGATVNGFLAGVRGFMVPIADRMKAADAYTKGFDDVDPLYAKAVDEEGNVVDATVPSPEAKDLSASAAAPTSPRMSRVQELQGEALANAYGLEKAPVNPIQRLLKSPIMSARQVVSELTEIAGLQMKNLQGGVSTRSAWGEYRLMKGKLFSAIEFTDQAWLRYVQRVSGDVAGSRLQQTAGDLFKRATGRKPAHMTRREFDEAVGWAKSELDDANLHTRFDPEVIEAAQKWDNDVYKPIAQKGEAAGAFTFGLRRRVEGLEKLRSSIRANGVKDLDRINELTAEIDGLKARIEHIDKNGIYKPGYVNRVWLGERVRADRARLKQIIMDHLGTSSKKADKIIDNILKEAPYEKFGDDATGSASSLKRRELDDIPDRALDGFISRDMTMLGQLYTRSVGIDADLAHRFGGSIDLKELLDDVAEQYDKLIKDAADDELKATIADFEKKKAETLANFDKEVEAGNLASDVFGINTRASLEKSWNDTIKAAIKASGAKVARLARLKERDLKDIRALRDLVRGTYGLSDDPTRFVSRAVRAAKYFNVLTQLTGAVSAVADLARIPMTEGINRTYGQQLRPFTRGLSAFKLATREARLTGTAAETMLSMRAASMADLSDAIANTSKWERLLQDAANASFAINLMNQWTDMMKGMASMVIGHRILEDAAAGGSERLLAAGIDKEMARRITTQAEMHAADVDGVRIANTDLWDDELAVDAFRAALGRDVDIAIITPSPGEKPLFMSRELGSLITQYKGFGFSSVQRMLIPGLQRPDANFLNGLAMSLALGATVDMIRTNQRDENYEGKSWGAQLKGAIDRSGILGYMMDGASAAGMLTNGMFGLMPALNAGSSSWTSKAGAVFGPTMGSMNNIATAFSDPSGAHIRRLLPLQAMFYADGLFDLVGRN